MEKKAVETKVEIKVVGVPVEIKVDGTLATKADGALEDGKMTSGLRQEEVGLVHQTRRIGQEETKTPEGSLAPPRAKPRASRKG